MAEAHSATGPSGSDTGRRCGPMLGPVQVGVLGETRCEAGGRPVDLGTRKQRAILAGLALSVGRPVSYDALVDLLWGDHPPDGLPGTLHVYIAGLRRALEPDRPPRTPATVLVTAGGGYALRVPVDRSGRGSLRPGGDRGAPATGPARAARPPRLGLGGADPAGRRAGPGPGPVAGQPVRRPRGGRTPRWPSGPAWRSCAASRWRTAPRSPSRSVSTAPSPRSWSRSPPPTRSGSGCGGCGRWRWSARAGRPTHSTCWRGSARSSTTSWGWSPAPELRELQTAVLRQDPATRLASGRAPGADGRAGSGVAGPARGPGRCRLPRPGRSWVATAEIAELCRRAGRARRPVSRRTSSLTGEPGIGKTRLCAELAAAAVRRGARVLVGPLLPGRRRTAAVALAAGARAGSASELAGAPGPRTRARSSAAGSRSWPWSTVPRATEHAGDRARRPALGRPAQPPGAAPAGGQRRRRAAAGARDLAVPPRADGPAGRRRRGAGPTARLTAGAVGARPGAHRRGGRCRCGPGALGGTGRRAGRPHGRQSLLPRRVRPAGARRWGPRRAAGRGRAADRGQRRPPPSPGPAAGGVPRGAPLGGGGRPGVPARRPGGGCGRCPRTTCWTRWTPRWTPAWSGRRAWSDYHFGHALVRDAVYGGFSATRRARVHARVAAVFAERPDRESEVARHWLAAGPGHAGEAWRAASEAARLARRRHAHEQAAELLTAALGAWEADPARDAPGSLRPVDGPGRGATGGGGSGPGCWRPSSRRSRWPTRSATCACWGGRPPR